MEAPVEMEEKPGEVKKGNAKAIQFVGFNLGDEEYALEILKIREIIRVPRITRMPKAMDFIEGVINLRGKVIPVVDLRKRFGLGGRELTKDSRVIVVDVEKKAVGVIVDRVSRVLRISADSIEPPPPIVTGVSAEYLKGVGKLDDQMFIILDVEKSLSVEERTRLKEIEET